MKHLATNVGAGASQAVPPPSKQGERSHNERRGDLRDIRAFLLKLGLIALGGWVLLGVVFGVAVMEGEGMYPRIRDGDLMVFYRLQQDYAVGDVVTFVRDGVRHTGRVVAQGGDTVDLSDEGELLVNGSVQDEEIFYPTEATGETVEFPCEVPEGSVFLLGDFRTNATDSRSYGPIGESELDGKVLTILRRRGI